jgi:AraC-like DNA-binding protein
MASHSILSLRYIVNRLRELGSDPDPILARHGIDLEKISPDGRIECALELRVFCSLCELTSDPLAGLKLGSRVGLTGYGPFSMMLMTCNTAWQAMQASARYQPLTYLFSKLELAPGQFSSELIFKPIDLPAWPQRLRIDMEVAASLKLVQDLSRAGGNDLELEQVSLPYAQPVEFKAYEELFQCPVRFGDGHGRLRLSNKKLQMPLASADSMANAMYRQECDKLLEIALRESPGDLGEQVRQHLMLFHDSYPGVPSVAAVFGISERSLRNHLGAEGLSFRQLLDQVRFARACKRLEQTRDSVESIALQLGYAETASFIHAFKRWAGCSPARYRKQSKAAH